MVEYKLELTTGDHLLSSTSDYIYATLIGTEGNSERKNLDNFGLDFRTGTTGTYTVAAPSSIGELLLVKLEKEQYLLNPEDKWFCSKVVVTTPEGDVILFPCYRWVARGDVVELRGGRAMKAFEDELSLLVDHRKKEVELHKQLYQWVVYAEGLPHMNSANKMSELPDEVVFSFSRMAEALFTKDTGIVELKLKGLLNSTAQWEDLDKIKNIFWFRNTPIQEFITKHWNEDDFFGSQFLNGINPNVIKRCTTLPSNFPVTDNMVQPFLEDGSSLATEMLKGNLFLCDYKILEDLPTRVFNDEPLPLKPALCLFYKNPQDKLLPIAIQLEQQPSEQNPIFLPSDSEHDWLLAKLFVRHADYTEHQIIYHLLRTHFLAEPFAVATLRNLPIIHPLYKLLIPHFRYTLAINSFGQEYIFGPNGSLTKDSAVGIIGFKELMKKAHSKITYSSLCLPENIADRGLESIPNFYYRDDGLKLWDIINSFVQGMVGHFYSSDSEVTRDSELQEWINEIYIHGFLGNIESGIPQRFATVAEVVQFITMLIFTVSAQHSAVNLGQFDYGGWVLNSPRFLSKAPPKTKGTSNINTILETLPDVGSTVRGVATQWLLSKKYSDFVPLGTYPDEHFDENVPKQIIKKLQEDLSFLSKLIVERNAQLTLPYNYLNPTEMENSVSI